MNKIKNFFLSLLLLASFSCGDNNELDDETEDTSGQLEINVFNTDTITNELVADRNAKVYIYLNEKSLFNYQYQADGVLRRDTATLHPDKTIDVDLEGKYFYSTNKKLQPFSVLVESSYYKGRITYSFVPHIDAKSSYTVKFNP